MGFGQAVSTCFQKYVTFSGRARRSEYWWWWLFTVIAGAVAAVTDNALGLHISNADGANRVGWISVALALFLVLPTIAVTFRRLHDTGRSGWWWLLALLCCVGEIIVFFFCISDSRPGANQYGPNPKGA
jgi:uncharacterized membrane protein YhaH (DUF805 family)